MPIVNGKHLRKISDRTALQSADNAEKFITTRKIDSFESLAKLTYLVEVHFSATSTQNIEDKLKRVILHDLEHGKQGKLGKSDEK